MPDLEPGDEVVVETADATYTYVLDTDRRRADGAVHRRLGAGPAAGEPRRRAASAGQEEGQRLITLTTCSELFHTDDRMVAFGVLTEREPREG